MTKILICGSHTHSRLFVAKRCETVRYAFVEFPSSRFITSFVLSLPHLKCFLSHIFINTMQKNNNE